jgi:hypothetical protein
MIEAVMGVFCIAVIGSLTYLTIAIDKLMFGSALFVFIVLVWSVGTYCIVKTLNT